MATHFRHYNLKPLKRYTLNVQAFGGIDFSSKQFDVSSHRAIDAKNYYLKNNFIQKRNGYEQLLQLDPTNNYLVKDFVTGETVSTELHHNTVHFNGMWKFIAEDGQEHVIAHIGKLLYEFKLEDKSFTPLTTEGMSFLGADGHYHYRYYEYEDYRSFAFVGKNRLWFLGGNHYMVIRFKDNSILSVEPVDKSEDSFIPTTTISISYTDAITTNRQSLDYPNMLNMWRQNLLLSGLGKIKDEKVSLTKYFEYELDGSLYTPNSEDDVINILAGKSMTTATLKALANIRVIVKHRGKING